MLKFKIGDKVLVTSGRSISSRELKGRVCTVSKTYPHDGYNLQEELENGTGVWEDELTLAEKKMSVNFHVLNESIVLNYNGKTQVIAKGDSRFEDVLEAIRSHDLDGIPAIVEIERGFNGGGLELKDGLLYAEGQPIPTELNDRIMKFREAKLPYDSLLAFWENLKKNPSFNSRKMLFSFLEHNGHPLTQDGCFIAYRGVTEDFKDCHTRTFDNKPGSVCVMDRSQVDDDPNSTCSDGLHVACFDYAKGFGPKLIEVKVDPKDVVCVPVDYNGTKMRVCRFEVVQECVNMREELVYEQPMAKDESEEEPEDTTCLNCSEEDQFGAYCSECGEEM